MEKFSRRSVITHFSAASAAAVIPAGLIRQEKTVKKSVAEDKFSYCLNASTIRGQKLGIVKELQIASDAGYDAMEVWVNGVQQYVEEGGALPELKMRIDDLGLEIADAIGFAQWISDDDQTRKEALEQAKKEMNMLAQIGCKRIAAPPAGATNEPGLNLDKAAERFYSLIEIGNEEGVMPQLEIWGFSQNLYKLSQILYVAAECGHPDTRILMDVYHLYKGGSDLDSLQLINGDVLEIFHMNDYSSTLSQGDIQDKDRVHVGDGNAPVSDIIKTLHHANPHLILSLELFNQDYWKQDALLVAKEGISKMKSAVQNALS